MNLFDKYLFAFPRSPDDPAVAEPEALVAPEPVAEPVATDPPEPAPDPAPDPAPALVQPTSTAPAMVPLKVMLERVGEETNKRQTAESEREAAVERARSFEEIVKRLQADPKAAELARPAAPASDQTVEQKAQNIVFQRDIQRVSEAGFGSYGQRWSDAVNALNAFGANSADFVGSVMEISPAKAHEIMFQIAQDGEKAVALARMSPLRRVAEITRIADAMDTKTEPKIDPKPAAEIKPEPKPAISRAPAPKPAVAPLAAAPDVDPTTPEGNEKLDDKAWETWYKSKYMRRTA